MKKVFSILLVSVVLISALMAFDGNTSASLAYSFEDGNNLGLSSENTGYFGSSNLGYYIGIDSVFNVTDISDWEVGMIVGPSYRYSFVDAGVTATLALGVSAEGSKDLFAFGVGAYAGGDWRITDHFGLGVRLTVGKNFVLLPYETKELTVSSRWYETPAIQATLNH